MTDHKDLTREQIAAGLEIVALVGQLIRESPGGQIPSGELYARLMDTFTLDQYESIISMLERGKLIERKHHLLRWLESA